MCRVKKTSWLSAVDSLSQGTMEERIVDIQLMNRPVLVKSQADLVALAALTQAGIAAKRLQEFRDGLIDLVIKAGLRVFL